MKKLIPRFGDGRLESRGDAFTTLARSIVGQQISVKAAQAVWDRFVALTAGPSHRLAPNAVLALDAPQHPRRRPFGAQGRVPVRPRRALPVGRGARRRGGSEMDDEAIIEELVGIRGIGRWTAEMFLIFHLLRPNVLPLDDIGLIKGISVNYFSGEPVSRAEAREVGDAWAPFRSVATWYIWRSLDPMPRQLLIDMTKRHFLDFEQPVAELEAKIEELRYVQNESAVDISEEIDRLSKKSLLLTKDIYSGLTPWQVTQIARHPQRPYTLDYVERGVHRFPGAARRPRVRRRPVDRRRAGALQRPAVHRASATRRAATPRSAPRATSACRVPRATARRSA